MFDNDSLRSESPFRELPHATTRPSIPHGECRFVHHRDGSSPIDGPRRCICSGFRIDETAPGSRCECGHQGWCHERELPQMATIPLEEHVKLMERVLALEEQLRKEREDREEEVKGLYRSIQGVYAAMALVSVQNGQRFTALDDKIEGVMDTTQACEDRMGLMDSRLTSLDEETIELHTRVDRLDPDSLMKRSATPVADLIPNRLSIVKSKEKEQWLNDMEMDMSWSAEVVFCLSSGQGRPFGRNTIPHYRCRTRNLIRRLTFENGTRECFVSTIENAFSHILANRPWSPLLTHTIPLGHGSELILNPLPGDKDIPDYWDYEFLSRYCMSNDEKEVAILYIALQDEELTWAEVRNLPHDPSTDNTCWHYEPELDRSDARSELDLDLWETGTSAPPPYSSKRPSRVHPFGSSLADTASIRSVAASIAPSLAPSFASSLAPPSGHPPATPSASSVPPFVASPATPSTTRSATPSIAPSTISQYSVNRPRSSSERSIEVTEEESSSRALKKQKLPSEAALDPPQMNASARSKRKLPIRESKPPPSSSNSHSSRFRGPVQSLLHRHHSDKEERESDRHSSHSSHSSKRREKEPLTEDELRCKRLGVL